jgi:DnaJ-class molecular chaperone
MVYHPDKNTNSEESNRIYRIILNAYKILSDYVKRKEYDEFLKKSEYIKNFGKSGKTHLPGKVSCGNNEILEKINITLWEIDALIAKNQFYQ